VTPLRRAMAVVAAVAAGVACACGWLLAAPGASYQGPLPELTMEDTALRDRLHAHVAALSSRIGERNARRYASLEQARRYIEEQFAAAGYQPRLRSYEHDGQAFHNVEAVLAGEASAAAIVVGAHYDSVTGSPGANDNATGVAVMLELARALAKRTPRRPVHFVAFPNEEPPYFNMGRGMGSAEYVNTFSDPRAQLHAMMSIETVGYYSEEPGSQRYPAALAPLYPDRGNFIGFVGNPPSRDLVQQVVARFREVARLPSEVAVLPASVPGVDWSDHRSFWERGVQALMITDTATFRDPHYHRSSDTAERLDYHRMTLLTRGLEHVLTGLAEIE